MRKPQNPLKKLTEQTEVKRMSEDPDWAGKTRPVRKPGARW